MKKFRSVLLGVLSGFVVIAAIEWLGGLLFPPPAGLNYSDPEVLKTLMDNAPVESLLLVLAGCYLGSLVAGAVAQKLSEQDTIWFALIAGFILNLSGIANMLMIPHPYWFWGAANCMFIPGAVSGYHLSNFLFRTKSEPAQ